MKTCFLTGQHDAPDTIQPRLNEIVDELVRMHGVTEFLVGHRGNFDRMATAAVQKIKKNRPDVSAYRLLAYGPEECGVTLPESFDALYYPLELATVPRKVAIVRSNQIALAQADYLVTYSNREGGNSGALCKRARSMEKKGLLRVWNLAERMQ